MNLNPIIPKSAALVFITNHIITSLKPAAIYAIGCHKKNIISVSGQFSSASNEAETVHYTLLVLAKDFEKDTAANTADHINVLTDGCVTVTLLLHKLTELRPRKGEMPWFFHSITNSAQLLFKDNKNPPILNVQNLTRNPDEVTRFWNDRFAVAMLMLDAASSSEHEDMQVARAALLHTAVENICLGLIKIGLGYTPNAHGLAFLIDSCSLFTNLPAETFPRETTEEKRLFKLLSGPVSTLRHRSRLHMDSTCFELLLKRTDTFLKQAEIMAQKELRSLREIHAVTT